MQQCPTERLRKDENLLTPSKPLAQLSVCRGFTISDGCNPRFPVRLDPGDSLLVLSHSIVARLAERDVPSG